MHRQHQELHAVHCKHKRPQRLFKYFFVCILFAKLLFSQARIQPRTPLQHADVVNFIYKYQTQQKTDTQESIGIKQIRPQQVQPYL